MTLKTHSSLILVETSLQVSTNCRTKEFSRGCMPTQKVYPNLTAVERIILLSKILSFGWKKAEFEPHDLSSTKATTTHWNIWAVSFTVLKFNSRQRECHRRSQMPRWREQKPTARWPKFGHFDGRRSGRLVQLWRDGQSGADEARVVWAWHCRQQSSKLKVSLTK